MDWSYSELQVRTWYAGKLAEWDWGLIAEDNLTAVGFVAVTGTHLDQLFVDPEYQRRGIGADLLKLALDRAPAVVSLHVFEQNFAARELYERHGFREIRRFMNDEEHAVELVYGRDPKPPVSS